MQGRGAAGAVSRRLASFLRATALAAAGGWLMLLPAQAGADDASPVLTGAAAFGDWQADAPGVRRLIRPGDLPEPFATPSAANSPEIAPRPDYLLPKVPAGFTVGVFAAGLHVPRMIRVAPNGDVFVAESAAGRIHLFRAPDGANRPALDTIFAAHLVEPFGIAFYPPGPSPRFVYVADTDAILRFPYAEGDTAARGRAETVVDDLPTGGHWTRDLAFSPDGRTMYVTIGSGSNDAEGMPRRDRSDIVAHETRRGLGAAWDREERRADVLAFDPDGGHERSFATGLRNCVSLAIQPGTDTPWCATNERDGLGDNLPPDYVTRVKAGAFYGWPWYFIGAHEDQAHAGERPDLAGQVTVPDVLLQAHSAPLGMTFYTGAMFPPEYRGDAFVALHGSWNRAKRTGYKLVRIPLKDGAPTGEYQDFMTGLVAADDAVYGRPVAVATAHDGALLVTDDAEGIVWRIAYGH